MIFKGVYTERGIYDVRKLWLQRWTKILVIVNTLVFNKKSYTFQPPLLFEVFLKKIEGKGYYCIEDQDFGLSVIADNRENVEKGLHFKLGQLCEYLYTTKDELTPMQKYIKKNLDLSLRIKNISWD